MKPLAECLDLIQGKSVEDFTREYPHAVLIGLGVIAGELQRNPKQAAGTMFLNLSGAPEGGDQGPLVNLVFNVAKVSREVPSDGVYIGGGTENDLAIPDSSVSKSHAHLLPHGDGWALVDHGSTNGTYINGTRAESGMPLPLKGGDILTMGRLSFTYYDAMSFAKLLFVQAMARGRSKSAPRTPGAARATATPGRSNLPPTPNTPNRAAMASSQAAQPAPWNQSMDVDAAAPRSPEGARTPAQPEWQQRAVGRLPQQGAPFPNGNTVPPSQQPAHFSGGQQATHQTGPHAPVQAPQGYGNQGGAQGVRSTGGQVGGAASQNMPATQPRPTSFFQRVMLKVAQFFQRLAGG